MFKSKESKEMVKKDETETSVTKHGDIFNEYSPEELAKLYGTTGTEDIPEEDRRPPLYIWNIDSIDESGQKIEKNLFYNTQSGEQFESITCSLLGMKKTRESSHRDEATGEKTVDCRSFDRRVGIDVNGDYRDCENCQDRFSKQGKRKKCTFVMRFVAWDFERDQMFVINVKRSSYVPMNSFMEKNFLNQVPIQGSKKKGDVPFYMLQIKITLKPEMGKDRSLYYVIQPEIVGINKKETVMDLMPMAESVKKMTQKELMQDEPSGESVEDEDVPF